MKLNKLRKDFSRRKILIGGGAALAAPAILSVTRAYAANPKLKVGFVSPKTGPLGGFAEADDYVVNTIQKVFSAGLSNNGKIYEVEIISKASPYASVPTSQLAQKTPPPPIHPAFLLPKRI